MKQYIDREAVLQKRLLWIENNKRSVPVVMVADVETIPAADVAEVVRCVECVYHVDCGYHYCNMWCVNCPDDADFFCAYGERDGGVNDGKADS